MGDNVFVPVQDEGDVVGVGGVDEGSVEIVVLVLEAVVHGVPASGVDLSLDVEREEEGVVVDEGGVAEGFVEEEFLGCEH